jgi:Flp pilus assembly protein TadB
MEQLVQVWVDNKVTVLISLAVGFLFFVLGPLAAGLSRKKVRLERVRKFKESLIDILEGMTVNQEAITNEKLTMMFRANERENEISVSSSYDLEQLLEDVILRFQRSRHIDATQKDAYANILSEVSRSLRDDKTSARTESRDTYRALVRGVTEAIEADQSGEALKLLSDLDRRLQKAQHDDSFLVSMWAGYVNVFRKRPRWFVAILAAYIIIVIVLAAVVSP